MSTMTNKTWTLSRICQKTVLYFLILAEFITIVFLYLQLLGQKSQGHDGRGSLNISSDNHSFSFGSRAFETLMTETKVIFKRRNKSSLKLTNCSNVPMQTISAQVRRSGRLGNHLFLYATLYALAKRNNRTALMSPRMASYISPYFNISMVTISHYHFFKCIPWERKKIPAHPKHCTQRQAFGKQVLFIGYPRSYKCFEDYFSEIRKELEFKDEIEIKSRKKIEHFKNQNATIVGVHIRRTDYVKYAAKGKFHLPTMEFYKGAMRYFQEKYRNVIFIIASDDIPWCESNFNKTEFNIKFLHNGSAVEDLAVLANSDHLIFGIGTYGFWAGFLNKGQVLYCSNCHSKRSHWLKTLGKDYGNFVLPSWIGIDRKGKLTRLPNGAENLQPN